MSEKTSNTGLGTSGNLTTAALIGVVYAFIEKASEGIALNPLRPDVTFNIAIFVPALAAILFGKNTGGLSAGLGSVMIAVQEVIAGNAAISDLPLDVIITSLASYLGAYLTGYLSPAKRDFYPSTFKQTVLNLEQWKRLILNAMASVVGLGMTTSFTLAYGTSLLDEAQILNGVPLFLENFFVNTAVLIIMVPFGLILFDVLFVFLVRKRLNVDKSKRAIEYEITEEGGAKVVDLSLPKSALIRGQWTPMVLKFKNTLDRATAYNIECVSTARLYPHNDKSKVLEPNEEWKQTFYVLSGKQKNISLRIQITELTAKAFKKELADDTTMNIQASTLNPDQFSLGISQFSGINFGVMGISIIWNDLVQFASDPLVFLKGLRGDVFLLGMTAFIESFLLALTFGIIYKLEKRKPKEPELLLSFTADQDAHTYEEIERKLVSKILKYQRFLIPVARVTLILSSLIGITYLGYEGFKLYTVDGYVIEDNQRSLIMWISVGILGLWVVVLKLINLVEFLSTKGLPPWILQPGSVILNFKPKGPIKVNEPTEIYIMAQNPTDNPGIRIVFESLDVISPPMVELHIAPHETVSFKVALTALAQEPRDILMLAYPFFDENGNEVDFNESEPINTQEITFQVQPQTMFGITKEQQSGLVKFGGAGAFITASLSFASSFLGDADLASVMALIQDNAPYLAAMQAPFAYAYYYIRNKYLAGGSVKL